MARRPWCVSEFVVKHEKLTPNSSILQVLPLSVSTTLTAFLEGMFSRIQVSRPVRWQRWLRRPQGVRLRRVCFQIHLWIGVALALYVVMMSLTGSALVYRRELTRAFDTVRPTYNPSAPHLSSSELRAAALRAFPTHTVTYIDTRVTQRDPTIEIWIERDGERRRRLFDPYSGADLGDVFPSGVQAVLWLARLHDDLLFGRDGRTVNGVGAIVLTLLCVTGAVIWWPGVGAWRRGVTVQWRARWPRLTWDLHSAAGFWLFFLILNWSVTGIYMAFPRPFADAVDYFSWKETESGRWGDIALDWLTRIHFGRWPNPTLKLLWAVLALVPILLAVTGLVMWWNRVLRQRTRS